MQKLLKWISIVMLFSAAGQLIAAESYGKAEDPLVAEVYYYADESKHSFYKEGSKEEKVFLKQENGLLDFIC